LLDQLEDRRSHRALKFHDFVMRDGQPICLMVNEHMIAPPEKLYGQDLKSNYSAQEGPRLAKWFRKK
jgi:deoxycytidine triphosphate deaminase